MRALRRRHHRRTARRRQRFARVIPAYQLAPHDPASAGARSCRRLRRRRLRTVAIVARGPPSS